MYCMFPHSNFKIKFWCSYKIHALVKDYALGCAQWNLSSFEFKFDNNRLASKYKNKIGLIKKKYCVLMLLCLCLKLPAKLRLPTGQRERNIRTHQFFQIGSIFPILWGNTSIIKFEFKIILVSLCHTYYAQSLE